MAEIEASLATKLLTNGVFIAIVAGGIYCIIEYTEVGTVIKAIFNPVGTYEKIAKEMAKVIKADIIPAIEHLADDAKKELSALGNDIKTITNKTEETIKNDFGKVENFFKNTGEKAKESVIDPIKNEASKIEHSIEDTASKFEHEVSSAVNHIAGWIHL